ncbi:hypothetical protein H1R20_g16523, partial [Candolleomyces eurysporus]
MIKTSVDPQLLAGNISCAHGGTAGHDGHDCEDNTGGTPTPAEHSLSPGQNIAIARNTGRDNLRTYANRRMRGIDNPGTTISTPPTTADSNTSMSRGTWRIVHSSATNSPNTTDSPATGNLKTPKFRLLSQLDKPGAKDASPKVSEAELSELSLKLGDFSIHQPGSSTKPGGFDPSSFTRSPSFEIPPPSWRASPGSFPPHFPDLYSPPPSPVHKRPTELCATASRYPPSFAYAVLSNSATGDLKETDTSAMANTPTQPPLDVARSPSPESNGRNSLRDSDFDVGSDRAGSPMAEDIGDSGLHTGGRCSPTQYIDPSNHSDVGSHGRGSGSRSSLQDEDFDGSDGKSSLKDKDFDVASDIQRSSVASVQQEESTDEDFDIGRDSRPSSAAGVEESSLKDEDFDVASDSRPSSVASVEEPSLKDEDFDVASDSRPSSAASVEEESSLNDEDFDVGSDSRPSSVTSAEESSLNDEDFDVASDSRPSSAASVVEESSLNDKDFDVGSDSRPSAASIELEESSLKDEDFDVGSPSQPSSRGSFFESSLKDEDFDVGSRPSSESGVEVIQFSEPIEISLCPVIPGDLQPALDHYKTLSRHLALYVHLTSIVDAELGVIEQQISERRA